MIRLVVVAVGTDAATGADVELVRLESDQYNLEELVRDCVVQVASGAPQAKFKFEKAGTLQIGIELVIEGPDSVRPSFHLDADLIKLLADIDAELDFDPYVY